MREKEAPLSEKGLIVCHFVSGVPLLLLWSFFLPPLQAIAGTNPKNKLAKDILGHLRQHVMVSQWVVDSSACLPKASDPIDPSFDWMIKMIRMSCKYIC